MVINELRLNFMDPRSLEILEHHMREQTARLDERSGQEVDPILIAN